MVILDVVKEEASRLEELLKYYNKDIVKYSEQILCVKKSLLYCNTMIDSVKDIEGC